MKCFLDLKHIIKKTLEILNIVNIFAQLNFVGFKNMFSICNFEVKLMFSFFFNLCLPSKIDH